MDFLGKEMWLDFVVSFKQLGGLLWASQGSSSARGGSIILFPLPQAKIKSLWVDSWVSGQLWDPGV